MPTLPAVRRSQRRPLRVVVLGDLMLDDNAATAAELAVLLGWPAETAR